MTLKACFSVLLGLATCAAWAAPDCLIVQLREAAQETGDPNFSLTSFVADQLDKDGRVRPVVWSLTDPVFRQWVNKDVFGPFEQNPSQSQALDTARKLGVRYVLLVRGYRVEQDMVAIAELFSNGRSVWRFGPRKPDKRKDIVIQTDGRYDEKATRDLQSRLPDLIKSGGGTFTVYQGGVIDAVETARAVASTWNALLGDGPFKDLPSKPRLPDPAGGNGQLDPTDVGDPGDVDAENVLLLAKQYIEQRKIGKALILLREACDRNPFDHEARRLMVTTMLASGMATEGAEAAQAATRLTPDDPAAWLLAAHAWVVASDPDKAEANIEAAKARGAVSEAFLQLEGDIALLRGDAKTAMTKYSAVKTANSSVRKAVALCLTGDSAGCLAALASMGEDPLSEADYSAVVLFVERSLLQVTDQAQAILPTIRLHPGAPETLSDARSLTRLTSSLSDLVSHIKPPKMHADSHEARKLAHILLAQAAMEALEFAEKNDPDTGEEAAATFAQAFNLFPGVREKFSLERKYGG